MRTGRCHHFNWESVLMNLRLLDAQAYFFPNAKAPSALRSAMFFAPRSLHFRRDVRRSHQAFRIFSADLSPNVGGQIQALEELQHFAAIVVPGKEEAVRILD